MTPPLIDMSQPVTGEPLKPRIALVIDGFRLMGGLLSMLCAGLLIVLIGVQIGLMATGLYEVWRPWFRPVFSLVSILGLIASMQAYLGIILAKWQSHRQGFDPKEYDFFRQMLWFVFITSAVIYYCTYIAQTDFWR